MQMMPSAAASFGVTDMLDPAQNIRAGARYLSMLGSRYSGIAENRLEKEKFALAAYNAGGGRIKDCIAFARAQGIDPHCWDDLAQVIPMMRDSASVAQVPEVRLGVFQGYETLSYVETVMAVYNEFCRIIQ
jgi:membrane-bound lytic murein transglycosylase F